MAFRSDRTPRPRSAGPAPTEAELYDAALTHLGRFAATEAGVRRVLERRIDRWARAAEAEQAEEGRAEAGPVEERGASIAAQVDAAREAAGRVIARLIHLKVIDDTAFAEARARGLVRSGLSRRAIAARLAGKGVNADIARTVLPDDAETELAAALMLARRRRIGPFRVGDPPDAAGRMRELAMFARAGFSQETARTAMATDRAVAEAMVLALRQ